jgi:hypothetical protein
MSFKKELLELFNTLFQLAGFIGFCYLITDNIRQSSGLGYIIALIWWQLNSIAKSLKSKN